MRSENRISIRNHAVYNCNDIISFYEVHHPEDFHVEMLGGDMCACVYIYIYQSIIK